MKKFKILVYSLLVLLSASSCCNHRCRPSDYPEPPPPFCVPKDIRVALVLGSGGVRGMAHVGVLEELEAAGIPIDIISIIQGLVIIFIAAPDIIRWLYRIKHIKVEETVLTRGWGK